MLVPNRENAETWHTIFYFSTWRQSQAGGGIGGVLLGFTDNTTANWNAYGQNGQIINSATMQGQWMEWSNTQ